MLFECLRQAGKQRGVEPFNKLQISISLGYASMTSAESYANLKNRAGKGFMTPNAAA